ncbi:MAG: tetratricopeptide repeat protein [Candidatus Margulisiibacteriota bacterium]|nr:tetratricopeptide repeat protein [Candidatus Margulisiibacteriota bacterium]
MNEDLLQVKQILRKSPDDPRILRAAGRCYLSEGEYKRARDYYLQAEAFAPDYLPGIILEYEKAINRNEKDIGIRLSLASFKLSLGETDACVLELEEALEIDPKSVEVYNVLGRIYIKQERIDEVIELLERSVAYGVRDVALTEILANAYVEKGRLREAIKFYEELLSFQPGDKRTLRVLGELYSRIEEYNRAADFFQAMFSDDPEVAREVIQQLQGLLKKVEGNIYIREILANVYMRSLKPEAAVDKLSEVLRLDPAKLQEVIPKFKNILKSYPDHPEATLAMAAALRIKGSFSEAVEAYYYL